MAEKPKKHNRKHSDLPSKPKKKQKIETPQRIRIESLHEEAEIFVGSLPHHVTEEQLESHFAHCGTITSVNLILDDKGRSKGIAYIKFNSQGAADLGLAQNGTEFAGRTIMVNISNDIEKRNRKGNTLYVGNVPYDCIEDELAAVFEPFGDISEVRIGRDKDGNPRGFAHVQFSQEESAEKAIQKRDFEFRGRPLKIDYANLKRK